MRAPMSKKGLTLVAVEFVGTYTGDLGQARVWAASIMPTEGQIHDYCNLAADFSGSVLVAWWKQHLRDTRPTAGIPMVKAGLKEVPSV